MEQLGANKNIQDPVFRKEKKKMGEWNNRGHTKGDWSERWLVITSCAGQRLQLGER